MRRLFLWRHRHCDTKTMTDWVSWGYMCRDHDKIWSAW